jgi:hypothetical protein
VQPSFFAASGATRRKRITARRCDIRGRSFTLRLNYRLSRQIYVWDDRLLPAVLAEVDESEEDP